MPPYNHPEQVSCLLPNQETDHTKLYLLQAPQPLSTNRSTARIIPTSFPGTKDVRDSLLFKAIATGPLLQHSLLPQGHRPTAPQQEGGFSSSLTPTSSILWVQRHAPIFQALKTALLDSLINPVAIPCSSPLSFSGGFTQSPCSHLLLTFQFTAVWFSLLKRLFLRPSYKSSLDGKVITIFLKFSTVWNTSPPVSESPLTTASASLVSHSLPTSPLTSWVPQVLFMLPTFSGKMSMTTG